MMFVKLGLLVLYLRLDQRTFMRISVYVLMFFVVAVSVAGVVFSATSCLPPSVFWKAMEDPVSFATKCMDQGKQQIFWDVCGVIVVVTDVLIWACPLPMIWKLKMPRVSALERELIDV